MLDSAIFTELKASGNLPSPKGSALQVMELCRREDMTLPELINALQVDPAMVGRILKLANSASFARSRPVVALTPDALMSVGVHSVSQMALAFSLVSENRAGRCAAFDYESFWSRSAATAVAFQLIGTELRAAAAGDLFTVGLLANIGRLALASIHPDGYATLLRGVGDSFDASLADRETLAFGYSHLDVTAAMMRDFGLPAMFCEVVLHHANPAGLRKVQESRVMRLVHGLHLASRLAGLCFVTPEARGAGYREILTEAHSLGIDAVRLAQIGDQMLREWSEWGRLLDVPVPELATFGADDAAAATQPAMREAVVLVHDPALGVELRRMLAESGYRARLVRNVQDALVEALDAQPPLMIVDLYEDAEARLGLIHTLRQTELGKAVYVLVLQAASDAGLLARALEAGADDMIDKPLAATVLAVRLRAGARLIAEQQRLRQEHELLRRRLLELSIASQHARQAALTDALTGLYNRRYAIERLAQEWAEAQRGQRPLAVLMVDIDHFKAINDVHGHDVGDAALCGAADGLRDASRLSDIVCRYGGEEFLVIASDTGIDGARRLGERLRSAIEARTLAVGGLQLRLTVSVGVAVHGAATANPQLLLKAADEALYSAKRNGRNRVESAP